MNRPCDLRDPGRPSRRFFAAVPVGLAALVGACDGADLSAPGVAQCPHEPDSSEPVEPLPACATEHECAHPLEEVWTGAVYLPPIGGDVFLGGALLTERGALVSWGTKSFQGNAAAAGFAILEEDEAIAVEGPVEPGPGAWWPSPTFVRKTEIGSVRTMDATFDRCVLLDLETGAVLDDVPVPLGGAEPPAVAALGAAVGALLVTPTPRFVFLDATLGERLADVELGCSDSERATLTATCGGLLATWLDAGDGSLRVVAFDELGQRRSPIHTIEGEFPGPRNAAWDGTSVVVTSASDVVELGINGDVVSRTPTPEQPLAAVGTSDGIVALTAGPGGIGSARVWLLERGSGVPLLDLGDVGTTMYGTTGAALAIQGAVYVASSSLEDRDTIVWARVDCAGP